MYLLKNFDEIFFQLVEEKIFINRHKELIKSYSDKIKLVISDIIEEQQGTNTPIIISLNNVRENYFSSNKIVFDFFKTNIIEYRKCKVQLTKTGVFDKIIEKTTAIINQNFCNNTKYNRYSNLRFKYELNNYDYDNTNNSKEIEQLKETINQRKTNKRSKKSLFEVNPELYQLESNSFELIENKEIFKQRYYSNIAPNGRSYNTINLSKKELRKRINTGFELFEIDMKSFAPFYFSNVLLKYIKNPTPFIKEFIEKCNTGDIYNYLINNIPESSKYYNKINRKQMKIRLMSYLTVRHERKQKPFFIPDIESFKQIEEIRKKYNYKLASLYQKFESDIMINKFVNKGFKFLISIHDCYIVSDSDIELVKELIKENLSSYNISIDDSRFNITNIKNIIIEQKEKKKKKYKSFDFFQTL